MIQRCESGRLIVDVKLPRRHHRKYETECEEGGGVAGEGRIINSHPLGRQREQR